MLGRTFIAISASLLACLPAAADPAKMCSGKYAEAATIVDQAFSPYETLYSGGNHAHSRDNVIGTPNVYRVLKGYVPLKLKDARLYAEDKDIEDSAFDERIHQPDKSPEWL